MSGQSGATLAFFEGNSWWYNVLSFAIGVIGFSITIWQILKTRRAAEAANEAARKTAEQFKNLSVLIGLSELIALAREAITLFEHGNFYAASVRALDLRSGLAQVRVSSPGRSLLSQQNWQILISKATNIHQVIVQRAKGAIELTMSDELCHRAMSEIFEELNRLAATAAQSVEPHAGEQ